MINKEKAQESVLDIKVAELFGYTVSKDLEYLTSSNNFDDCLFKIHDVKNTHAIFGSYLAGERGKTVRHELDHVTIDYIYIPIYSPKLHKHVTIVFDVMFVNNIPFLVKMYCSIKFTTVEHIPTYTDK